MVLRRLSNAEYTYAIRDLTGVASLDPAKEFPADCAAGEGFTNVGNALVMSPTLVTKYLAAAKSVAEHAVLLPDGLRFAAGATRRDWTDELLAQIRTLYRQYTDPNGADMVDLQGIVFATNGGGRLPVAKYLDAALLLRDTASHDTASHDTASHDTGPDDAAIAAAARARGLSPKYLALLWRTLTDAAPSPLLDQVRASWRGSKPGDGARLAATIAPWQQRLFAFRTVGPSARSADRRHGSNRRARSPNGRSCAARFRRRLPAATR